MPSAEWPKWDIIFCIVFSRGYHDGSQSIYHKIKWWDRKGIDGDSTLSEWDIREMITQQNLAKTWKYPSNPSTAHFSPSSPSPLNTTLALSNASQRPHHRLSGISESELNGRR